MALADTTFLIDLMKESKARRVEGLRVESY
jgi:hypothetical protein